MLNVQFLHDFGLSAGRTDGDARLPLPIRVSLSNPPGSHLPPALGLQTPYPTPHTGEFTLSTRPGPWHTGNIHRTHLPKNLGDIRIDGRLHPRARRTGT